jgi:hypothetical protein
MKLSIQDKWLIGILCCLMAIFPNCGKSPNEPSTPPKIPPAGTMFVDLSFFRTNPSSQPIQPDEPLSKLNFFAALTVVTAFNAAVLIGLSVPAAAAAAALSVEPTFESDGKFHWNFSYPEDNPVLTLELTAEVRLATVKWEMFVTSPTHTPPLSDFLWYEGESELDGETGYWQFYDDQQPAQNVETVLIDWQFIADDDRTLTFTNVKVGDPRFGDRLRYQIAGEDVAMLFTEAASGDSVQVAWNMATGEGFIIAPNYRNGQKSCWNSTQDDIDCP